MKNRLLILFLFISTLSMAQWTRTSSISQEVRSASPPHRKPLFAYKQKRFHGKAGSSEMVSSSYI